MSKKSSERNKLTIIATYWNERDWIQSSLNQIDKLKPQEAFICDGCFDPLVANYSTDGTREVIERWCDERPWAHMVEATRVSRLHGLYFLFLSKFKIKYLPLRIALLYYYHKTHAYRINQAVTFTKLIRKAKHNKIGDWIMHIDADQFYPDKMLDQMINIINQSDNELELLTAKEKTFFHDFDHYTDQYDARDYNNMPYKIRPNMLLIPTRDVMTEQYPKPIHYGKDPLTKKLHLGFYHHYKFRPHDQTRSALGNTLGDRKAINTNQFTERNFFGTHPSSILEWTQ